ncbi:hypothetical protein LUZ60_015876 [Juncus effusus]|nr:hypothetical protein LUZ60_015876 [Juncus effusus]
MASLFSIACPALSKPPLRIPTPLKTTPSQLSFKPLKTPKPLQHRRRFSRLITRLFTGIVEEIGEIGSISDKEEGFSMRIGAQTVIDTGSFSVGLSPETLRRTSLGSPVNLERALTPDSRMGGHFVQGHLDDTGEIVKFEPEGDSLWVKVKVNGDLLRLIVPKGFIAVDGTSLTVVKVYEEENCFDFMLVAYTQQKIVIPMKKVGDKVNLEVDILGKYVEKFLNGRLESLNLGPLGLMNRLEERLEETRF